MNKQQLITKWQKKLNELEEKNKLSLIELGREAGIALFHKNRLISEILKDIKLLDGNNTETAEIEKESINKT